MEPGGTILYSVSPSPAQAGKKEVLAAEHESVEASSTALKVSPGSDGLRERTVSTQSVDR